MKKLALVAAYLLNGTLFAQNVLNEKNIEFVLDNSNLQVVTLQSDENSSSFAILIRESVKPHYHKEHTESIMVLDGSAEMQFGDSTIQVQAGDFLVIPPGTVHSVQVTSSDRPLKVISVQAPQFNGDDRVFVE